MPDRLPSVLQRQCAGYECQCGFVSIHRKCRPCAPDRRWSRLFRADSFQCRLRARTSCRFPMNCGHAIAYAAQYVVPGFLIGTLDCKTETEAVGRAMALYHDAFQAQQAGAIVSPGIHAAAKGVDDRQRHYSGNFREQIALEFLAQVWPRRVGRKEAMAGRSMPGSIFNTKREMAIRAPVFPALTQAWASRFFTASMPMRIDDSRLPRNADAGASSIATTSGAGLIWIRSPVPAPSLFSSNSMTSGNRTRRIRACSVSSMNDRPA